MPGACWTALLNGFVQTVKARWKNNPSEEEGGDKKGSRNVACARERWVQVKRFVQGKRKRRGSWN